MVAYYNEIDPYAAAWLRNLIAAGRIPWGYVDERDIRDVTPADLAGYSQCHFFAGIGGWPLALALAGWPDNRAVWTGSCPCQPFSAAGQRKGFADDRHLWPDWFWLVSQCRPPIIFGEQTSRATVWLDQVFSDLESEGYACGAADLPAAGVDAWHARQRLWFVAHPDGAELRQQPGRRGRSNREGPALSGISGQARSPADADSESAQRASIARQERFPWDSEPGVGLLVHGVPARVGRLSAYGNAIVPPLAAEFIKAYLDC